MPAGFLFYEHIRSPPNERLVDFRLIRSIAGSRAHSSFSERAQLIGRRAFRAKLWNRCHRSFACALAFTDAGRQIGFARAVTDFATFAWLADVLYLEEERGDGLSKKLVAAILAHPQLQGLRRFMLARGTRMGFTRSLDLSR